MYNKTEEKLKTNPADALRGGLAVCGSVFLCGGDPESVWRYHLGQGCVWPGSGLVCPLPDTALDRQDLFSEAFYMTGEEQVRIDAVQICCFACICLMTLYYYNSGSEYGHSPATRVMNSAFGIALFTCMGKRSGKEAHRISTGNLCSGFYYRHMGKAAGCKGTGTVCDEWRDCVDLLWRAGRPGEAEYGEKEICTRFSPYGWLVFLLFAGMVMFRNTRTWPFLWPFPLAVCIFTIYAGDNEPFSEKTSVMAVFLAFWLMFGSGILFRPYYSFEFVRYPGWFNSVATAGLFWMLVFGCSISCILAKFEEPGSIGR